MDQGCLAVLVVRLTFLQVFIFGTCHGTDNYVQEARPGVVPRFLSTNTNLNRHRGDTAVLECAVENLGDRQVIWRKASSTSPITVGTDSFVEDARIEAEHPPGSSQWNLVIRDLRPEDAGVYECQVSSKQFRYLRHHVTLLVSGKSRFFLSDQVNGTRLDKPTFL
ncbi:uncharacterized protein LOC112553928 [Pomacea canaliculata]|uniref:uncharacterized protein LOC112553928 n=1 Tax=Pomacea canaliculata TaxID=400727 RepID=UPI000D727DA7|nr:uncharacterized protein LOC112553928 [Pomacea canaliculata]